MNLDSSSYEAIHPKTQGSIIDTSNINKQIELKDNSIIPSLKYSSAKLADNESRSATSKAKFKLFAASKKNLTLAVIVVVSALGLTILWLIYSNIFSNKDAVFNSEVSRLLNKGSDPEMNKRLQKMFDDSFGYEKAQGMGKQYCQDRASGLSEEDTSKQAKQAINLMFQQKVTSKEAVDIAIVEADIHLAANKAYCPQFKPAEQEPLKERLNQQKTSEKDQALAKYKDQTRIPLGRDLTLDVTSAKQLDNGLMEVIGRADKDKDLRLRYIVDCGEKTFSMTALNYKAGKEGQWLAVKNPRAERSAAFSALVCP